MQSPGVVTPVYLRYSDLFSVKTPERYWQLLRKVPRPETLGILARINSVLAGQSLRLDVHRELHKTFLSRDARERIHIHRAEDGSPTIVFHRRAITAVIRTLILYGSNELSADVPENQDVGELILCANDFIDHDPPAFQSNLDRCSFTIGSWNDYNLPHVGHSLARLKIMFDDIASGTEPQTAKLRDLLGASITLDGLSAEEFWAATFCILAATKGDAAKEAWSVLIDTRSTATNLPKAMALVERLISARSLSIGGFASRLGNTAESQTYDYFSQDLQPMGISSTMVLLRQFPLLRLDQHRALILDRQLVFDLLSSGTYWIVFESLPGSDRETFRSLWGHVFESYAIGLLEYFYPPSANVLQTRVEYNGGEIDALLDFGEDVVVFEIKSSRLKLEAKCSGDRTLFERDVIEKFVRNSRGKPKAVAQLARSTRRIASRASNLTSVRPRRVYPVVISDEPGCECLGFNAYLNELFRAELGNPSYVKPLTVMTIDECENVLPHIAAGDFSWRDIFKARIDRRDVSVASVGQTMNDMRLSKHFPIRQNLYLSNRYNIARTEIIEPLRPPVPD